MTQLMEEKNTYLTEFRRLEQTGSNGRPWLEQLRKRAMSQFAASGFPNTRQEEWRHTNVAPIARTPFRAAEPADLDAALLRQYSFGRDAVAELVFVNGHYSAEHSRIDSVSGIEISTLARAIERHPDLVERHLGRQADIEKNPFVALNTSFVHDGAFIHIRRGAQETRTIHLLFLTTESAEPTVSHPRVLVVVEQGAQATLVETYAGSGGTYFTNGVTEIICGADSVIDHCKMQQESRQAYHVATMQVDLGRAATFVSHSASLGSRLTRNDLNCVMNGEGAYATLNGLVIINGDQHVDNHTLLHHEKPNCPSHELYKHVMDGNASAVFKGQIFVAQEAQKTDSKQTSKSLLLSDDARIYSQPALEIYADDVKCTHGSTVGPVDEDMIFYLRTRGVSLEAARHLLTYAFAADVTRRIKVVPVRRRLENFMAAQHGLPQDIRITDLGSFDDAAL